MADPITALPTPPSRQSPSDFSTKADVFLGALPQFVAEVNAAAAAMNLNATTATSTTELTIGTGSQSLTVETAKSFLPGMSVKIARTASPSNWMAGDVTSYNSGTGALVVNVTNILGNGTHTDWTVTLSGPSVAYAIEHNADGTHKMTSGAAGDLFYHNGTQLVRLAKGTALQCLLQNAGLTAPEWASSPQSILTAQGDLLYANAANTLARLALGTAFQKLVVNAAGNAPQYVSGFHCSYSGYTSSVTGNLSLTGTGFRPNWGIMMWNCQGVAGTNGLCLFTASHQFSLWNDANASPGTYYFATDAYMIFCRFGGSVNAYTQFVSMDADGMTMTRAKDGSPTAGLSFAYLLGI